MAVRGIDYNDGGNPLNYKCVDFSLRNEEGRTSKEFNSGDFVKDWYDGLKWFIQSESGEHLCNSSSVDHFIMDGGSELYDSAYLKFREDGTPYLDYVWDGIGLELFVAKGTTPTWEELREICNDPKKDSNE